MVQARESLTSKSPPSTSSVYHISPSCIAVSFRKEEKLAVIKMKDKGLSYEEISKRTGHSRVNMEKWCSAKVQYTPSFVYGTKLHKI